MPKVFISHTWRSPDKEISERINRFLKKDGADVWVDYESAKGGDSLPEKIGNGIVWCEDFVLLWSKTAAESYWVKLEWETALSKRKRIIPCPLDDTEMPAILERLVRISFRNFDEGYENLCRALKLTPKGERPTIGEYVEVKIEESKGNELKMEIAESTLNISVKENVKKITSFGFELRFNPSLISFESVKEGTLTLGWAAVDGNEKEPGSFAVGGFAGAGKFIAEGSSGSIAVVRFKTKNDKAKCHISIQSLTDDIVGMSIVPSSLESICNKTEEGKSERKTLLEDQLFVLALIAVSDRDSINSLFVSYKEQFPEANLVDIKYIANLLEKNGLIRCIGNVGGNLLYAATAKGIERIRKEPEIMKKYRKAIKNHREMLERAEQF